MVGCPLKMPRPVLDIGQGCLPHRGKQKSTRKKHLNQGEKKQSIDS